ncbi:uncharacterized protein LOC134186944 [Corticium candelabrum]|uniref:uncharacterized protein LOC134186944 n=1 Tax=Corticium candelabrum TaxID=121492 RepID=UPI002E26D7D9|nr:uncharacterized protein LOC134186944 [Corticium candelabrum]
MKSVFLCGAHSVGKTTLLASLAQEQRFKGYKREQELARGIIKQQKLKRDDFDHQKHPDAFERLQLDILQKQNEVEERNTKEGVPYLMDRGIDPLVYARYYLGEEAYKRLLDNPWAGTSLERYRSKSSRLFVIEPHQQCIEDDGVRVRPNLKELQEFTRVMKKTLDENRINYTIIHDLDIRRRVQVVLEATKT